MDSVGEEAAPCSKFVSNGLGVVAMDLYQNVLLVVSKFVIAFRTSVKYLVMWFSCKN